LKGQRSKLTTIRREFELYECLLVGTRTAILHTLFVYSQITSYTTRTIIKFKYKIIYDDNDDDDDDDVA